MYIDMYQYRHVYRHVSMLYATKDKEEYKNIKIVDWFGWMYYISLFS